MGLLGMRGEMKKPPRWAAGSARLVDVR